MSNNSNYCQVTPMTEEELRDCYSKLKKKELIEMLIQNHKVIELLLKTDKKQEDYKHLEVIPTYQSLIKCKTWADCTNPHFDCVNCPLRHSASSNDVISVCY